MNKTFLLGAVNYPVIKNDPDELSELGILVKRYVFNTKKHLGTYILSNKKICALRSQPESSFYVEHTHKTAKVEQPVESCVPFKRSR